MKKILLLLVVSFSSSTFASGVYLKELSSSGADKFSEIRKSSDESLYGCVLRTHQKLHSRVYLDMSVINKGNSLVRSAIFHEGIGDSFFNYNEPIYMTVNGANVAKFKPNPKISVKLTVNGRYVEMPDYDYTPESSWKFIGNLYPRINEMNWKQEIYLEQGNATYKIEFPESESVMHSYQKCVNTLKKAR